MTLPPASLEIACFNPASALTAQAAGADRIELCANKSLGGITPPMSWLRDLKPQLHIPLYVMIRPRGGDFEYSQTEFSRMKLEMQEADEWADGFVFGILKAGEGGMVVDGERNGELVGLARGKPCTFHRAIEGTVDQDAALEVVISCGFAGVLTAGGFGTAVEGVEWLGGFVGRAGGRIVVIPGGGVREEHLGVLRAGTGALWFHSSACVDGGEEANFDEVVAMKKILQ
jgi:copper homeostasis protein